MAGSGLPAVRRGLDSTITLPDPFPPRSGRSTDRDLFTTCSVARGAPATAG